MAPKGRHATPGGVFFFGNYILLLMTSRKRPFHAIDSLIFDEDEECGTSFKSGPDPYFIPTAMIEELSWLETTLVFTRMEYMAKYLEECVDEHIREQPAILQRQLESTTLDIHPERPTVPERRRRLSSPEVRRLFRENQIDRWTGKFAKERITTVEEQRKSRKRMHHWETGELLDIDHFAKDDDADIVKPPRKPECETREEAERMFEGLKPKLEWEMKRQVLQERRAHEEHEENYTKAVEKLEIWLARERLRPEDVTQEIYEKEMEDAMREIKEEEDRKAWLHAEEEERRARELLAQIHLDNDAIVDEYENPMFPGVDDMEGEENDEFEEEQVVNESLERNIEQQR
ncbi:hypothetical protein L3Y34_016331 [Caenorhabditis briggsae]|uniref:Uncharacterized protein n=2 Tax=Caenorhabditis briggsae TaxID=6238 RepID=A0AAE9DWY1_CAEBR|nr:hypothetical protein L3Y34_016331 [Caenorhabditis briggsae]